MAAGVVVAVLLAVHAEAASGVALTDPRFGEIALVQGLTAPTAVAVGPGGRLFVAEKAGKVLSALPGHHPRVLLDISHHVNTYDERGLLGIALDRDFSHNGHLYLLYSYDAPGSGHDGSYAVTSRLTRVTVSDPATDPITLGRDPPEKVLLGAEGRLGPCPAPANDVDCLPAEGQTHSGDTVRVDPRDGTLWVSNGDGAGDSTVDQLAFRALDETSYAGKILHVDVDGRGLPGHPFCPHDTNLQHVCTKVYASGFRNPFRFSIDASTGRLIRGRRGLVPLRGDRPRALGPRLRLALLRGNATRWIQLPDARV